MDINHLNTYSSNLSNIVKKGKRLLLVASASLALSGCCLKSASESLDDIVTTESSEVEEIDVLTDDLNHLNIVLRNDALDGIYNEIFDRTVMKLQDLGVNITVVDQYGEELSFENSTVITITRSSISHILRDCEDSVAVIFGATSNAGSNNNDILACALKTGFLHHNMKVDGVLAGRMEFNPFENEYICKPTGTERLIDKSSSFTCVDLGNELTSQDVEAVSDSIIDGLGRAAYEIKSHPQKDYLHRLDYYEVFGPHQKRYPVSDIADYLASDCFQVEEDALLEANPSLADGTIEPNDMVISPDIYNSNAFHSDISFAIKSEKIGKSK